MAILDFFKKSKEARKKKEEEEKQKRADEGQKNYEAQKTKPEKDAWVALNE